MLSSSLKDTPPEKKEEKKKVVLEKMKSESWVSITGHVLYFQIFLPGGAANLEEQSK